MTGFPVATGTIEVGHHITTKFLGLTFDVDTIGSTCFALLVVLALGFYLRRKVTSEVPGRVQTAFETIVEAVQGQVESSLGVRAPAYLVPLAMALFVFILVCNWIEIIPTGNKPEYLPAPTSDVNLPYAMALLAIVWVHIAGVRRNGPIGYVRHFVRPPWALVPINFIEELVKPFTLSLRLFGNIFAGGIMIALFTLFPAYLVWAPNIIWKMFDFVFIGPIQAFIFSLLTILYFSSALGETAH